MAQPQIQDLLEAGVHFGHQTRRWNPKMRRFIFAERSGIYIIDLQKTVRQIQQAQELLRNVVLKGEGVLFVCTKKQLTAVVASEAANCGAFWVTERWLGGMLTNFQTIKRQIRRLRELEQGSADGEFENYTKKEKLLFEREREKLLRNLEGIKQMGRLPGALFVVDAKKEKIAVQEATSWAFRWWRSWTPMPIRCHHGADPRKRRCHPGGLLITAALSEVIREARTQVPLAKRRRTPRPRPTAPMAGPRATRTPTAGSGGRGASGGRSRRRSRPGSGTVKKGQRPRWRGRRRRRKAGGQAVRPHLLSYRRPRPCRPRTAALYGHPAGLAR